MKAGQTELDVGTKVVIKGIRGEDKFLNGMIGWVTHPFAFGCTDKGWVGIRLDEQFTNMIYGDKCNVRASECKIIK